VKTRRDEGFGRPIEAVDRQKEMRVSKGGLAWLRLLDNPDIVFRFDVVEVLLPDEGNPHFELIQNAFELSQPYIY
jgi:putative endonuclease